MTDTIVVPGEVVETSTETPAPVEALSLKAMMSRYASIDAFEAAVKKFAGEQRAAVFGQMLARQDEDGTKSFNVMIDGETAATATITEPQDKIVVDDPDLLLEWVETSAPSEVETVSQVRPAFEKVLLSRVERTEDGIVDPVTGELVPGLKFVPAPAPSSFSLRWKSQARKKEHVDNLVAQVGPMLGITAGGDQ